MKITVITLQQKQNGKSGWQTHGKKWKNNLFSSSYSFFLEKVRNKTKRKNLQKGNKVLVKIG